MAVAVAVAAEEVAEEVAEVAAQLPPILLVTPSILVARLMDLILSRLDVDCCSLLSFLLSFLRNFVRQSTSGACYIK